MTSRRSPAVRLILVMALAGLLVAASAPGTALAGGVGIHLSCYSNPETTTIRNNTGHGIKILSIRSTYQPQDFEPFLVNKHLDAGQKITYETGFGADKHVLTNNFIYYNNNELDGVKVKTNAGIFKKHC